MIPHSSLRESSQQILRKLNYMIDLMNALLGNSTPTGISSITGTTLDLNGIPGSVATIDLSSNSSIDTFSNDSNYDFIIIRPASGYSPSFLDKSIGAVGSNLRLGNPTITLNGTGRGFLALQKRDGDWYQVNLMDTYNI